MDDVIDRQALARDAAALGLALSPAQCALLARHAALLLRWNRTHNLTAIENSGEVLTHHLLDSLALVPVFERVAPAGTAHVLDVGSGGGLPGIPLAIACPRAQVMLVDKVGKKVAFMTQARVDLGLANVQAVQARIEDWRGGPFDVIVSRAFSSLPDLVALTRHLLAPAGGWLAMKGKRPDDELKALPKDVVVVAATPVEVPGLNEARHVVELRLDAAAERKPS